MLRSSFVLVVYVFVLCISLGAPAVDDGHSSPASASEDEHGNVPPMTGENETSSHNENNTSGEGEHHEEEEGEHHEEEEHHLSRHAVIWPSTLGMMIFIVLCGYLFFYFYSRRQMKKFAEKHHSKLGFFEQAVISSTVTGAAAPAILAFSEECREKAKKSKEDEGIGHKILRHLSVR